MDLKSVSGLVFFVKDLDKTTNFYEALGFTFKVRTDEYTKAYLNWFWMDFVLADKAEASVFKKEITDQNKGNLMVEVSVADVNKFYAGVLKMGLKPASEPKNFPWGRREFVLHDPDGYKLVFFEKT